MIIVTVSALVLAATAGGALAPPDYPSCDLKVQREVRGHIGGSITDVRQAHISERVNILQADIGTARVARRLTQAQADDLWKKAADVRRDANAYIRQQGFLSAAERASYDRELDAITSRLCEKR